MNLKNILIFFITSCILQPLSAQEIKIGNYIFKDGAEYQGEIVRRKPHGKGKTIFKNGDIYEGEYIKGKRHGMGTYLFADGEKYIG